MPNTINKCEILGRLGQDPELRYTQSGTAVVNLSVATDDYRGPNQDTETDWHRVTVWGKSAEAVNNYVSKGDRILIHGRIKPRSWTDTDGTQRHGVDVVAEQVTFLELPRNGNAPQGDYDDYGNNAAY